jgi:peptide/nickel transport system ATP-binding protein
MTEGLALSVSNLSVQLTSGDVIVEGIDLRVAAGDILGLVGESGSGKTTTALAMLGYAAPGVEIVAGDVSIAGELLVRDDRLRSSRGSAVAYVPQNPAAALNPSLRIIESIEDVIRAHRRKDLGDAAGTNAFVTLGLPDSRDFGRRFPHQLSGGQQQRVCIAVSLVCEPAVVVLDEPTTGLDVVTQARILKELLRLRDEQNVSMVYVTHDLAVVAQIADRIAVMYAGRIVEEGPSRDVLRHPRHPYTRGLMSSIPDHARPSVLEPMTGISVGVGDRPAGCAFAPRCSQRVDRCDTDVPPLTEVAASYHVRCFEWSQTPSLRPIPLERTRHTAHEPLSPVLQVEHLRAEHRSRGETVVAAGDVSFTVERHACVALVGESGSGKTTIARAIAGLHPLAGGQIMLDGEALPASARHRSIEQRRKVQLVFQDPADALNPRHTVRFAIGRPARILRGLGRTEVDDEVTRLLECVRLPARLAERYPAELSGGERQRVAIARALASQPEVIICDEVTSALDVSVQAAVLSLLADLRADLGVSLLFITHDLGVVATVADTVLVLEDGLVCEEGPTEQILKSPGHPYTQGLLAAAPSLSAAIDAWAAQEAARGPGGDKTRVGRERPLVREDTPT